MVPNLLRRKTWHLKLVREHTGIVPLQLQQNAPDQLNVALHVCDNSAQGAGDYHGVIDGNGSH